MIVFDGKIISGGQTGVDRGALDAAVALGIPHGGWCPRGRRAEDGRIPDCYKLEETTQRDYRARTCFNIRDSDATLILTNRLPLTSGTMLTQDVAWTVPRACFVAVLGHATPHDVHEWMASSLSERDGERGVRILNVAGPRESKAPGIREAARDFLIRVLTVTRPASLAPAAR